jgi:hypothetical protein
MLDLKVNSRGATTSASMPAISSILRRHAEKRRSGEDDSLSNSVSKFISYYRAFKAGADDLLDSQRPLRSIEGAPQTA